MINEILKGKEISIPHEHAWSDKDGHLRTENRIKWWCNARSCYGEFLFDCPEGLKDLQVDNEIKMDNYPLDAPPIFLGPQFWRKIDALALC